MRAYHLPLTTYYSRLTAYYSVASYLEGEDEVVRGWHAGEWLLALIRVADDVLERDLRV